MKHAKQSEIAAEMTRLPGDLLQGMRTFGEERVIAKPLMGTEEGAQFLRDGEGDQEVTNRQQPLGLRVEPGSLLRVTALIAGAVAATVIGKALASAVIAGVEAAARRRGVAAQEGGERERGSGL
jgi:hypothetical protein